MAPPRHRAADRTAPSPSTVSVPVPVPVSVSVSVTVTVVSVIVDAASGASGKVRQRAGDSQGISQVWFADGERLEGGRALDQNQASKLERAR